MIARLELAHIIAERTLHEQSSTALRDAVAAYLMQEGAIDELDSLMRDVQAYRAARGYVEATIVSAYPLSSEVRADVRSVIAGEYPEVKNIIMNETVDPLVVGGLRIELAGEELDLTVRAKLNTFKRLTATRKD